MTREDYIELGYRRALSDILNEQEFHDDLERKALENLVWSLRSKAREKALAQCWMAFN